jgi:hypothetical protein
MRVFITHPNTFTGDELIVGKWYEAVLAEEGTNQQNKTFHKLLQIYWTSGQHSYNARNFAHFKILIKIYLGAGKETYYKVFDDYGNLLDKPKLSYRVKSWRDYTKAERMSTIQNLIADMLQAQVQTVEFYNILDTLEKNSMNRMAG